jgi:NADH-quinone oxidoreductase subunit F
MNHIEEGNMLNKILDGNEEFVESILKKYNYDDHELLQMFVEIQKNRSQGYIDQDTIELLSRKLGIPEIRIHSVISYYDALTMNPGARYSINVCNGTTCSLMGNSEIEKWVEDILKIKKGETTDDGMFSLRETPCFGACDITPAIRIGDKVYGKLTRKKVVNIIEKLSKGEFLPDDEKTIQENGSLKIITSNFNKYDGMNIVGYIGLGGFEAFENAVKKGIEESIDEISKSGIRGRGGAQYPTGKKLSQSRSVKNDRKVIVCNADEGEPGTFKDREILKKDPYKVIEGMLIASYLTDATEGFIYLREEYYWMRERIINAIEKSREYGWLGENIKNSGHNFDIRLVSGAGSYVCGEGFALCESLEGKPGIPRSKPPYVKQAGYLQLPTLIINVETLAAVTTVLKNGSEIFTEQGTEGSPGTKVVCISGKVKKAGIYEVPFGISMMEMIDGLAGGVIDNRKISFVQIGGASGGILPASKIDINYDYESFTDLGMGIGSGAVVVADDTDDIVEYTSTVQEFFSHESCGKCTPCREGNKQLKKILKRFMDNRGTEDDIANYKRIVKTMEIASLCGGGKTEAVPLNNAMEYFEDEFRKRIIK